MTQWQPPTEPWHPRPVDIEEVQPPVDIDSGFPHTPPPLQSRLTSLAMVRIALSWLLILILTLTTIVFQDKAAMTPPADPMVLQRPGMDFTIQGKLTLWLEQWTQKFGGKSAASQSQIDQQVADFEGTAWSSQDLIRTVVIRGEIYGRDEALFTIEDIRTPDSYYDPATGDSTVFSDDDIEDLVILESIYLDQTITSDDEDRLLDRHQWFGEIATTHNLLSGDESRDGPRGAGGRLLIGIFLVLGLVLLMGLAGFVLLIVGIVKFSSGKLQRQFASAAPPREAPKLIESFTIFMLLFAATFPLQTYLLKRFEINIGLAVLALLALTPLVPLLFGIRWQQFRSLVGLHKGAGILREIGCGLLGYMAGLPLIAAAFIVSVILMSLFSKPAPFPAPDEFSGLGIFGILLIVSMFLIWAPVVEELLFRGILFSHCRRWLPWPVAAAVVGVIFAAIHPQGIWMIPGLAMTGFVFAAIREWRGTIVGSMTAHFTHNGIVTILLLWVTLS